METVYLSRANIRVAVKNLPEVKFKANVRVHPRVKNLRSANGIQGSFKKTKGTILTPRRARHEYKLSV